MATHDAKTQCQHVEQLTKQQRIQGANFPSMLINICETQIQNLAMYQKYYNIFRQIFQYYFVNAL